MYRCTREKVAQSQIELKLAVTVNVNGTLLLACDVPESLECTIMTALQYLIQENCPEICYKNRRLEILIKCLRKSSPSEKQEKLKCFCEQFTEKSGVAIIAVI